MTDLTDAFDDGRELGRVCIALGGDSFEQLAAAYAGRALRETATAALGASGFWPPLPTGFDQREVEAVARGLFAAMDEVATVEVVTADDLFDDETRMALAARICGG